MTALRLEFAKLRRKHIWLIAFACMAAALLWVGSTAAHDGIGAENGARSAFFGAPFVNAMILTVLATVVTSRVCDVDHEARAWNQLLCHERASQAYLAKFACIAIVLFFAVALETAGIGALVHAFAFPDIPGASEFAALFVAQYVPALGVAALTEFIALKWENQFITLSVGLLLALAGLFGLYLPAPFPLLIPSGYFGTLSTVAMDWNRDAEVLTFYFVPFAWHCLGILAGMTAATLAGATAWFARKDL